MNRITNAFSNLRAEADRTFSKFGGRAAYRSSNHFFQSNTLIAKVAFLLLMVIFFLIVVRMGTAAMVWLASPSQDPSFWVSGACNTGSGKCNYSRYQPDGTIANTWMQGGGSTGIDCGKCPRSRCQTVLRSKNGRYGIEFSWSIWLWIDHIGDAKGQNSGLQRQHIFSKGSDTISMDTPASTHTSKEDSTGMLTPNNAPGLYLDTGKNSLYVVMNTFDMINEEVEVNDIPLKKWINIIIRNEGRILDVYVNGTIAMRHKLSSVPKQNYGNVHVSKNGGFNGKWSLLRYHDYALNTTEIMNIVRAGPDLRTCTNTPAVPPYLSMQWYFDNPQDVGNTAPYAIPKF